MNEERKQTDKFEPYKKEEEKYIDLLKPKHNDE